MNLNELGIPEVGRGILRPMMRYNETYEQYRERCDDGMKKILHEEAFDRGIEAIRDNL